MTVSNPIKFKKAYEAINNAGKILIVTHDRPDGDALSSVCVLLEFLSILGKSGTAYCRDNPPYQFSYLPHIDKIVSDKSAIAFAEFDLIIAVDCGGINRTGIAAELRQRDTGQIVIEFDHHPKIDSYADIEIKEPALSSTAELLYYFFRLNRLHINKNMANCILTGLLTDTANFLHDSTRDTTIKIASEMLLSGASFPLITESTWRNKRLPAMKLWGEAINNLEINRKYGIAFTILPHDTLEASGVSEEELEGLAGFLSSLSEVNALLVLREVKKNVLKGSLRACRPGIDVSYLAQFLGGGGHAKASGFVLSASLSRENEHWQID